jgi:hypothetical protein
MVYCILVIFLFPLLGIFYHKTGTNTSANVGLIVLFLFFVFVIHKSYSNGFCFTSITLLILFPKMSVNKCNKRLEYNRKFKLSNCFSADSVK